ncbi:hypothetical protein EVG20_g11357 [Dentipellis fragilis]|uniref:Uncharacterized protein n=1 Tax=Dentipellis fragilis TaxID=205917 RepID=A0A4Y9XN07_9AGAM|nr:hypothetical protein EVG20_g11357 [Dentipellis fragilis]
MPRKATALTKKRPNSATGSWKAAKPRKVPSTGVNQASRPRPRPTLAYRSTHLARQDAEEDNAIVATDQEEAADEEAAETLTSMQRYSKRVEGRLHRNATDTGDDEEVTMEAGDIVEDEWEDNLSEEIDELAPSSDHALLESDDLILPVDPPVKKLPKFAVPIEVPYRHAYRDIDGITSRTLFNDLMDKIATKMGVRLTLLAHIGYIPSYKPKSTKPVPKLLEGPESWCKLLMDILDYIEGCKAKNKGKGAVKPFTIVILDTSEPVDDNKAKSSKKKHGNAAAENTAALTTSEVRELDWYRQIEKVHHCQQHQCACYIKLGEGAEGVHYQYTPQDLASGKATLAMPPDDLKLGDQAPHQCLAKRAAQATADGDGDSGLPKWAKEVLGVGCMLLRDGFGGATNPPPPSLAAVSTPPAVTTSTSSLKRTLPLDYPDLDVWLASLDEDQFRGKHSPHFFQSLKSFHAHDLYDLGDLHRLDIEKVMELGNLKFGLAKRLVSYVEEDVEQLSNHSVKRPQLYTHILFDYIHPVL